MFFYYYTLLPFLSPVHFTCGQFDLPCKKNYHYSIAHDFAFIYALYSGRKGGHMDTASRSTDRSANPLLCNGYFSEVYCHSSLILHVLIME